MMQTGNSSALVPYTYFRFRDMGDEFLLTNEVGDFVRLNHEEFRALQVGSLAEEYQEAFDELGRKGFIRSRLSKEKMISRYARKFFVGRGVGLHIVILTLRCNHTCVYCHASAEYGGGPELDMTLRLGRKVVDTIFTSKAPSLHIELQGGEALMNLLVLKDIVIRARAREKTDKRPLMISVVSNFSTLTDEIAIFLLRHDVKICSSFDGPQDVNDWQRRRPEGQSNYAQVKEWVDRLKELGEAEGKPYTPQLLLTVTRQCLPFYREIIDEYRAIGTKGIFLHEITKIGTAVKSLRNIGYTAAEFVEFYRKSMDYILSINRQGELFYERGTFVFLQKILTEDDPNFMDISSPSTDGIGQIVYNYDGDVYSGDKGWMLSGMGDKTFKVGSLDTFSFDQLPNNPVVKTCCSASCLDVVPGCSECAYKPYCGTFPAMNYLLEGQVYRASSFFCDIRQGILDYIFEHLKVAADREIFYKWLEMSK